MVWRQVPEYQAQLGRQLCGFSEFLSVGIIGIVQHVPVVAYAVLDFSDDFRCVFFLDGNEHSNNGNLALR
jgi:hypothetical protein